MKNQDLSGNKFLFEYEYDFVVIGMVCPSKEYVLAWHINDVLEIDLYKTTDYELDSFKKGKFYISSFHFETECSTFRLYKNKSAEFYHHQNLYLLPEFKAFDYILVIEGEEMDRSKVISERLSAIHLIQLVKVFDLEEIESKDNLLI